MKTSRFGLFTAALRTAAAFLLATATAARASTVWSGPITNFIHAVNGKADQIVPGVSITRGGSGGLYNSVTEHGAVGGSSPKDTTWAVGSLANFATLKYAPCPLEAGNRPPNFVNTTYVVHLVTEDIYFSLTLSAWGGAGGNGQTSFSYARSTPAAVTPPPTPTVAITSPANGANFTAPASVNIEASAAVSTGTVTNVQFFTNGVALGAVPVAPFALTASGLTAGSYALTAVATAAGLSATSAVVNITVTNAVAGQPINITAPGISGSQFSFNYSTQVGLSYVIESSSNLVLWLPLMTNVASGGSAQFSDTVNPAGVMYYRVGQSPAP